MPTNLVLPVPPGDPYEGLPSGPRSVIENLLRGGQRFGVLPANPGDAIQQTVRPLGFGALAPLISAPKATWKVLMERKVLSPFVAGEFRTPRSVGNPTDYGVIGLQKPELIQRMNDVLKMRGVPRETHVISHELGHARAMHEVPTLERAYPRGLYERLMASGQLNPKDRQQLKGLGLLKGLLGKRRAPKIPGEPSKDWPARVIVNEFLAGLHHSPAGAGRTVEVYLRDDPQMRPVIRNLAKNLGIPRGVGAIADTAERTPGKFLDAAMNLTTMPRKIRAEILKLPWVKRALDAETPAGTGMP